MRTFSTIPAEIAMNTTRIHTLFIILLLILSTPSIAQSLALEDTLQLSLDQALERAKTYHPALQQGKTDLEMREADATQSLAVLLPQVTVSFTGSYTNDPLNVFGTKLLQEQVTQADFNPVTLNAPDALANWQSKIEVMQPLVQPEGLYQRKAVKSAIKAQQEILNRTEEGVQLEITQRYLYWVLAIEATEVIEEAKAAAQKNLKDAKALFEEGIIDKADLLSAELFVEQLSLKLQNQQTLSANAADGLKQRIGLSASTQISPSEYSSNKSAESTTMQIEQRADIQALKWALSAEQQMYQATRARFLPSVGAFGSYQWNDENSLFGQGENFMVGVQAKIPVLRGGLNIGASQKQKLKVKKAQIQLEDISRQAENEFRESERQLALAESMLKVSELGKSQAEEAYRIKKDRHAEGLVRTFELIQAQTTLLEQKLNYLKAGFDLRLAEKKRAFAAQ